MFHFNFFEPNLFNFPFISNGFNEYIKNNEANEIKNTIINSFINSFLSGTKLIKCGIHHIGINIKIVNIINSKISPILIVAFLVAALTSGLGSVKADLI